MRRANEMRLITEPEDGLVVEIDRRLSKIKKNAPNSIVLRIEDYNEVQIAYAIKELTEAGYTYMISERDENIKVMQIKW